MASLFDRTLHGEELLMHGLLQRAIHEYGPNPAAPKIIRRLLADRPGLFVPVALQLLKTASDSPGRQFMTILLINTREVILRVTDPLEVPRPDTLFVFRRFMETDSLVDVRLARQLPGRDGQIRQLGLPHSVRVLDALDEISPGRRLLPILSYLTGFPEPRLAGKATMLVARRVENPEWINRHMAAADPRIRANVLEGLWDLKIPYARETFLKALQDTNNRVVGNAVVGLYLLRDEATEERLARMAVDCRMPFRCTAAWIMGRLGKPENIERLHRLLEDDASAVRGTALRALLSIRHENRMPLDDVEVRAVQEAGITPPPPPPEPEPESVDGPEEVPPEEADAPLPVHLDGRRFLARE